MPFNDDFDAIYNGFIEPIFKNYGFLVKRADDIGGSQNILRGIVQGINDSELIIADLTEHNPNVYYELGLAHGLGKSVLLLTQNIDGIPFDLKVYQHLAYSRDFAQVEESKANLENWVKRICDGELILDNPIDDFL